MKTFLRLGLFFIFILQSFATFAMLKFEDAVFVVAGALPATAPNKRRNSARRLLQSLTDSSHLISSMDAAQEAWCWLG